MFSAFEWMMAMRYLRARRQEGFISVIAWFSLVGIALGVATLIIVMSVMNGFRQELLERILGINGHLSVYGPVAGQMTDYQPLIDKIVGVDGVVSVNALIEGQVMASAKGVAKGAIVRGIRAEDLEKRKIVADNIRQGSLSNFKGDNVVMIGARLAQSMGVHVGDDITLISPKGNVTAFGTVPRMRAFKIVGTFEIGMYEYDSGFVFMPLEAAQIYFRMPEKISNLEVFLDNPQHAETIGRTIARTLGGQGSVHDWQRANASFFNAIQVERNVMFLILTLIILVAAFNIISSLIMLVKDKGRDIAILRTMGATRGMIMRIFLIAGASVGVIGTLLGFGLGLSFAANIETIRRWIEGLTGTDLFAAEIYFLSQLPAVVDPTEVTAVVLMGLGLSFLATIYPSWRAARIDPAEALRYE
ncbi:lipoprotein-releasing ABC transporter permease subunit [Thalassospiraceae bacterium LMO-JJ14]|nr:lipoprotein-releasing ABC transporter permease subunit [Thalassospiraceae bacterium LMO-JJ14]